MENLFISGPAIRTKAAFGAAFALFLGVGAAAVLQTYAWESSVAWVSHSFELLGRLSEVAQESKDLWLARRALLDNPVPEADALAKSHLHKLDLSLLEVARLSADNPFATSQCRILRNLALSQLSRDTLASSQTGFNSVLAALQDQERNRLASRITRAHQIASYTRKLFEFACALSFLLAILAFWRTRLENRRRNLEKLEMASREAHYRGVVENAGDLIFRTDPMGRFTFCNHTALTTLLLTDQEVMMRSYLKLIRVDHRRRVERFYLRQFAKRVLNTYCEFPVIDGHGRERWLGQNVQLLLQDGQVVTGFQGISREITERVRSESGSEKNRAFLERMAENTPGLLYVYDIEERLYVFCNSQAAALFGHDPLPNQRKPGESAVRNLHPDDLPALRSHYESLRFAEDREIRRIEYRIRHSDGHWVWLAARDTAFERGPGGLVRRIVGIANDVTERKAAQEKAAQEAKYDELTGLATRQYFAIAMQRILSRAAIAHGDAALCLFRIEDFREIKRRFGATVAGEVLKRTGDVMRAELRPNDLTGRMGEEEFAFLLPGAEGREALLAARRLRNAMANLNTNGQPELSLTVAFGVAEWRPGMSPKELLEAAEHALFQARETGEAELCDADEQQSLI